MTNRMNLRGEQVVVSVMLTNLKHYVSVLQGKEEVTDFLKLLGDPVNPYLWLPKTEVDSDGLTSVVYRIIQKFDITELEITDLRKDEDDKPQTNTTT